MVLRSVITSSSSAMSGQTAKTSPLLVVRRGSPAQGVPREREYINHPNMLQMSVGGRRKPIPQNIGAADSRRRRCRTRSRRRHLRLQREGCSLLNSPIQARHSRRHSEARKTNSNSLRHIRWQVLPLWNPGSLWPCRNKNSRKQVSQFGLEV
jgi:hypothetical protein